MESSIIENIIILNWGRICRICLSDESILFPINESDDQYKMSFCDMLNICSNLNVSNDDSFPQLICSECIRELCTALEFKMKCQSSDDMLNKLLPIKQESNNAVKYEEFELEEAMYYDGDCENTTDIRTNFLRGDDIDEEEMALSNEKYYTDLANNGEELESTNSTIEELSEPMENIFECEICHKSYRSYRQLADHKRSHTNTCWECNLYIKNDDEYNEHMKIHNTTTCPECGKTFRDRKLCKRHIKIHAKDKFLCITCGKKYCSISALSAHSRIHTGEKRYECNYCGKKFLHWSARRYHIRSAHTLEKPYCCEICDNRYIDKASLILHIRDHTGEKPFQCNICSMRFKGRKSLRVHMYTHTGQKRVYCEVCNKGFSKNYNLKLHMVVHTGERKHVCVICSKTFTQAHAMRSHMKRHPEAAEMIHVENLEVELL